MELIELFAEYVNIHKKLYPPCDDVSPYLTIFPPREADEPLLVMIFGGDFFSHEGTVDSVKTALRVAIEKGELIENNVG